MNFSIKNFFNQSWVKSTYLTAITFPIGDIIAQYLMYHAVDPFRVFYMAIIGGISGLMFHVYFPFVDRRFNKSWANTKKILTTEFLFVPLYYPVFFVLIAFFQGKLGYFGEYLRETYFITYLTGQLYWLTVNLINFNLFKPSQRIKVMACAYVPWGLYLSLVGHLDIQGQLVEHLGEFIYVDVKYICVLIALSVAGLWAIFRKKAR